MKLIDKDKVISMLQDKIADIKLDMKCGFLKERKGTEKILVLKHIISLVNTLEMKDVDLEKEINLWFDYGFPNDDEFLDYIKETAKHFYELGLKAQKGESVMKFYIKPKNIRECEIWDSGWRCGLTLGIVINIIVAIAIGLFI